MKRLFIITTLFFLSFVSFSQKVATLKTPSSVTLSLLDGLDFKNNITFKIVEPTKFDNVYGKTSLNTIKDVLQISNLFLQFEMKNQNSYKPIVSPINKIMLMEFDGKTIASITIVAQSENGYGNKITKEYHCYTDLDGTNFKLSSY